MGDSKLSLEELENQEYRLHKMEQMIDYSGEDRVISTEDLIEEIKKRKPIERLYSGIKKLDDTVDGFSPGELIVVSGPTGMGKTTLLQTFTKNFSQDGNKCLWFSFEVIDRDLLDRYGDEIPVFYLPRKSEESSLDWIRDKIWEGLAKFNTRVVFIDHLHFLITMKDLSMTGRQDILIGQIMRGLKQMALETETIIFLVSHIKKIDLEEAPKLSDLRDSSFIGQESDMVFMVWRGAEPDMDSPKGFSLTDKSFLSVEKNRRKGKYDIVELIFNNGVLYESLL